MSACGSSFPPLGSLTAWRRPFPPPFSTIPSAPVRRFVARITCEAPREGGTPSPGRSPLTSAIPPHYPSNPAGIQFSGSDGAPPPLTLDQLLAFRLGLARGLAPAGVTPSRVAITAVPDDAPWAAPPGPPAPPPLPHGFPSPLPRSPPPSLGRRRSLISPLDGPVVYSVVSGFGTDQIPVALTAEAVSPGGQDRNAHPCHSILSHENQPFLIAYFPPACDNRFFITSCLMRACLQVAAIRSGPVRGPLAVALTDADYPLEGIDIVYGPVRARRALGERREREMGRRAFLWLETDRTTRLSCRLTLLSEGRKA